VVNNILTTPVNQKPKIWLTAPRQHRSGIWGKHATRHGALSKAEPESHRTPRHQWLQRTLKQRQRDQEDHEHKHYDLY
jgi:hypothetical protein